MNTLIERTISVGLLALASCAPEASEPLRNTAHDQTARALVGNLRRDARELVAHSRQAQQMAEYVGRYSAATGRITFEPLLPQGSGGLPRPGYTQLLSNTVSLDDNGTTVGEGGSFNSGETCDAGQICAVVTLTNDSGRLIENLRVEVVDLTAGASVANGDALGTNYPSTSGNAGGWNYQTLAAGGSASAAWRFNSGGADFTFNVRVWGVYTRTGYSAGSRSTITTTNNEVTGNAAWSDASPAWRDACLFGTTLFSNTSAFTTSGITPPFAFTFGDTTIDSDSWAGDVEVSSLGTISLMGVANSGNLALNDGPDYTIFPYWDELSTANGSVCAGTDPTSSMPNRRWVVTWKNVSLQSDSNTRLTFSVVIQEQSDNIYFLYHRWSGSASDCSATSATQGSGATIGVRGNGAGAVSQISFNSAVLGIHPSYPCPGAGVYYKLTATPANP